MNVYVINTAQKGILKPSFFFRRQFSIVTFLFLKLVHPPVKKTQCGSPAFGSDRPASRVLHSANPCLFVTSDPVFLDPNRRQRCTYCTDPSCPEAPVPATPRILPSMSAGSRGSWRRRRWCNRTEDCNTLHIRLEARVRSSRTYQQL